MQGTHHYSADPRNETVQIYVNGELVARDQAVVSVFDSGFVMGDGIWESFRVHEGRVPFLDRHLDRLFEGAAALDIELGHTREELAAAIATSVLDNGLRDHVHVRLMISRGVRATPYQDPRVVISPPTVVIVPEVKAPTPGTAARPLSLFTVHVRRGRPDVQDPHLNSHSKLNCITACIQATKAGADEALMLDPHGFVATCNSTHFFIVRRGQVWTSSGDYCLEGITRSNVLRLCREHGIPCAERNFSLTQAYGAEEAFCTGTFAGLAPVGSIDGRTIGSGQRGPMVERLQRLYQDLVRAEAVPLESLR